MEWDEGESTVIRFTTPCIAVMRVWDRAREQDSGTSFLISLRDGNQSAAFLKMHEKCGAAEKCKAPPEKVFLRQ